MTNKISVEIIVNNKCNESCYQNCSCGNTVIELNNAVDVVDEFLTKGSYHLQDMDVAVVNVYSLSEKVKVTHGTLTTTYLDIVGTTKELLWRHKVLSPFELMQYIREIFVNSIERVDGNNFVHSKSVDVLHKLYEKLPLPFIEEYFRFNREFPIGVEVVNVVFDEDEENIYTAIGKYVVSTEWEDGKWFFEKFGEFIDYEYVGEKYVNEYGWDFVGNFVYKEKGK